MPAESLHNRLRELEECLLRPEVRCSPQRLSELLADDFVEFSSSGCVFDRSAIIASLAVEPPVCITISDFRTLQLAPDAALALYRATFTSASGEFAACSLRCSVWRLIDNRWRMLFHQGTKVVP